MGRKILVIFVPEIKRFPDYTTIQNRLKKAGIKKRRIVRYSNR